MTKKIGFLLPNFAEGGMPKVASNILCGLDDHDYEKHLILLDKGSEIKYEHGAQVTFAVNQGKSKIGKVFAYLNRIRAVRKIKQNGNFDTVISFGVTSNIINIVTKSGEKTISTEHNIKSIENKTWGFFGKIYDVLIKLFYNKSDEMIVISKVMKQDLIENYNIRKDITIINNPHIINTITQKSAEPLSKEEEALFKDKATLVTVGRLTYAKGHWHLIRVVAELKKSIPTIQLLILGIGEMEEDLKRLTEQLGVEENVKFLGFQSNPYKFIKNADVFVLSSLFEGFPNVLIETLACGTPIVSADCKSGPREILDHQKDITKQIHSYEVCKYGILTPEFDGEVNLTDNAPTQAELEMALGIKKLLSDHKLYNEYENLSKQVAQEYDVSKIIKQYQQAFNS
ncbi:glycosyltransferase [Priestia aryabhattai]|uniref:glycosyltransferase n=1 Tax=Priestia aryabhattai TaxID=412384 RepID=UPI00288140DB|nr:glycosyltransferase [Priestia aryabhattai]MDT0148380.1 glycosyltransferase [Priestia aryabhattai]MDT0153754.1 glycosyltransferase [Priestia aryabhattai]